MHILGISCFYHDAAACLVRDGEVVAAAEEERFSRMKHDARFPLRAARFCLAQAGLAAGDVDHVVFYEKTGLKLDRVLSTLVRHYPRSRALFSDILRNWGREKLWFREMVEARLGIPKSKVLFSEHHLSHAASAFHCSPFEKAAVLTLDGVGEWVTATLGTAEGTTFRRAHECIFPHSLGLLYTAFTEFLGFEVNDGEYKVMGMAPYGEPRYCDKVERLFLSRSETGFELDMDHFDYECSRASSLKPRFLQLWGEPRKKEEPFFLPRFREALGHSGEAPPEAVLARSQYFADVAASVQKVVEEQILLMVRGLRASTGLEDLCVAGGVAYNSAANGRLMREGGFRRVYIQPGAGDSGAAIGAALAVHHALAGRSAPRPLHHVYLGEAHSEAAMEAALQARGHRYRRTNDREDLVESVADRLASGQVIGWFQGRFEFGPRALGSRSLLADPRSLAMKEVVNARVKFRELFRPFAPVGRPDTIDRHFEVGEGGASQDPYRFMLAVVPVRPEAQANLQAVTHVDGSARIQIVHRETNPDYHDLIAAFGARTGVDVLLNTSFNRRGEPIVASPEDALTTFEWSAIDALAMGPFLVERPQ